MSVQDHPYALLADKQEAIDSRNATLEALSINEILHMIGQFLDRHSLTICLRVNKEWHPIFIPLVWSEVKICLKTACFGHASTVLEKYAPFIRKLVLLMEGGNFEVKESDQERQPVFCPNLVELFHPDEAYEDDLEEPLSDLIHRHRSSLKVLESFCYGGVTGVGDVIYQCQKLEVLHTGEVNDKRKVSLEKWLDRYESFWSRLRNLSLSLRWEFDQRPTPSTIHQLKDRAETRLEKLELQIDECTAGSLYIMNMLIAKSPHLVKLLYHIDSMSLKLPSPMSLLAEGAQDPTAQFLPRLQCLQLMIGDFDNADFQKLLTSTVCLVELQVHSSSFDATSWKILKDDIPRYRNTLRSLDLRLCRKVTGSMVHNILCTILTLREFSADYIAEFDLVEKEQPWVCLGLKSLRLGIVIVELPSLRQPEQVFLDRFSKLEALEYLDARTIFVGEYFSFPRRYFRLDLLHGMDTLKTLRQLKFLGLDSSRWGLAEIQWVSTYWPKLETCSGIEVPVPESENCNG
ncbi:hypothetical protein EMPS_07070 [Entomortierella parvispora]|uniref:Uncharacterized protein n=1 Tax=Entomortierella parvispora TaxID=205924 RepID=A0A9P3HDM5_9FUNG|nr:hypothetical protein EMPS_07070 [Entomortierella parvispora]